MKKKIVRKGFDLNKQTVANLTGYEQSGIVAGGVDETCPAPECGGSNSAVLLYSTNYYNTQGVPLIPTATNWPCLVNPTNTTITNID